MTSSQNSSRASRVSSTSCALVVALSIASALPVNGQNPAATPHGRTVAVGDVHGDFDSFVNILQRAGLVDKNLKWTGGTATLVQTGDVLDRGVKVRQVLDLLMALESQAEQSGGHVIVLLGNHEVMNMTRDVRDVAPAAYTSFVDDKSAQRQERAYREYASFASERTARGAVLPVQTRDEWLRSHPLGFIEYTDAFGSHGVYGRWLRSRPVVVTIGDTAFLHAGIDPESAPASLDAINRRVRDEIRRFDEYRRYLIDRRIIVPSSTLREIIDATVAEVSARNTRDRAGAALGDLFEQRDRQMLDGVLQLGTWDSFRPDGPLWFRGFATWTTQEGAARIQKLQQKYDVAHWIVGHTISSSLRITPRFESHVFLIDTGMMTSHYAGERGSALEILDGRFTAISSVDQTVLLAPTATAVAGSEKGGLNPQR